MPYYLYRIQPLGVLKKLDQFERFRRGVGAGQGAACRRCARHASKVKVMFAENRLQAETC